jgi:FtsH-binding integral membrane protein
MEFLKTITGKVVTGLVALGVIAAAISWWQMDPATRQTLLSGTGRIFSWLMIVLILPWASFFIIGRIAKLQSNLAGGLLIAAYTILETLLLAWLFHWHLPSATAWTFLVVGGLFAAVYNLLSCDFIAEKVE